MESFRGVCGLSFAPVFHEKKRFVINTHLFASNGNFSCNAL